MGNILSRMNIWVGTRLDEEDTNIIPIHHKCRNCGQICNTSKSTDGCANAKFTRTGTREQPEIIRPVVPDNKVRWNTSFNYHPVEFTSEKVLNSQKEYIDRDPREHYDVVIPWNSDDVICDRRSYHGTYKIAKGLPQNPCGRTGVTGRGHLGHFGPNHAADPIVTRWKRDENGKHVYHPKTNKPILQFVCIRRKDTHEYAIPGGMVEKKEKVTDALQREFQEEALHFPEMDKNSKRELYATIKDTFENGGIRIYCGYVDDPRNTDNSWMETTAYNFHDDDNSHVGSLNVNAGSDATSAFWHDLSGEIPLFASHSYFLYKVAELHNAHW